MLMTGVSASHEVITIVEQIVSGIGWNAVTTGEASSAFLTGSGLTRIDQLGNIFRLVAVVIGLFIAIWAIIAEFRAWGADGSDSFGLFWTVIRGSGLFFAITIVLNAIV